MSQELSELQGSFTFRNNYYMDKKIGDILYSKDLRLPVKVTREFRSGSCYGCAFYRNKGICINNDLNCSGEDRKDAVGIIFIKVKCSLFICRYVKSRRIIL